MTNRQWQAFVVGYNAGIMGHDMGNLYRKGSGTAAAYKLGYWKGRAAHDAGLPAIYL